MKVWIDVANSPQVALVLPFIKELEEKKYKVLVTSRPHANTEQLLMQSNINFYSIGGHYGSSKLAKILGLLRRSFSLYKFLKNQEVSCAFSQSSFYSPLVSFFLGINSIYTNDNEFAKGNYIAALFATKCYFPHSWPDVYLKKMNKTNLYMGVKESIYMSNFSCSSTSSDRIYYRPEAWDAEYYNEVDSKKIINVITILSSISNLVILPRNDNQAKFFQSLGNDNIIVEDKPLALDKIMSDAMLFVGSGGSMSRELALTKIPTITCYDHGLLSVDRELINLNILNFISLSKFDRNYVLNVIASTKNKDLKNVLHQGIILKMNLIKEIEALS